MKVNPLVVDISHYQVVRSFREIKASGYVGVINKATEGLSYVDPTFASRRPQVKAAGLLYGAYHFLRPVSIPAQVKHFIDTVQLFDDLLLALDHEDPNVSLADAKLFLKLLEEHTGRVPVLYSGFLIKEQLKSVDKDLARIRFWLSHYSSTPKWPSTWPEPWLWQFTGDGTGPLPHAITGIDGTGIDINSFNGTPEQLAASWTGAGVVNAPIPPPAPEPAPAPFNFVSWLKQLWNDFIALFGHN